MKDEEQIRQVIALQKQIEENKKEVSQILTAIIKNNKLLSKGCRIVLDGELWELGKWPYSSIRPNQKDAWKLSNKGKVMS